MKSILMAFAAMLLSTLSLAQCFDFNVHIYSNVNLNGPTDVEWTVKTQENVVVASGAAEFNAENPHYYENVCLEEGCYQLRIVGNGVSGPETFFGNMMFGEELVEPSANLVYGTQVFEFPFCLDFPPGECSALYFPNISENEQGFVSFNNESTPIEQNVSYWWSFGDGTFSDESNPTHTYADNGEYTVCLTATYSPGQGCILIEGMEPCVSEYCTTIIIENIEASVNCPESLYAAGECGEWVFEAGNFQEGENVIWYFGDEVVDNAGHFIQHTFTEEGVYNVCAYFTSNVCPEGVELCEEITVNLCSSSDCAIEIEAVQLETGFYEFTAYGSPEVYPMHWTFGDGTEMNATWVVTHQFDEPGEYTICGMVESELCPEPVQGCVEIVIEEIPSCTNVNFSIDSYMEEGGASFFEYDLINLATEINVASGVAQYTPLDPYFDQSLCLQNGCYELTFCTGNNDFDWTAVNVLAGGPWEIISYEEACEGNGRTYLLSLNGDCGETVTCEAFFEPVFTQTAGHIEFVNQSTYTGNVEWTWTYGNGSTSYNQGGNVYYTENGTYEVCLSMVTAGGVCSDEYCTTVIVDDFETPCEYNEIVIYMNGDYVGKASDVVNLEVLQNEVVLTSLELPVLGEFEFSTALCIPDGCYEFNLTSLDAMEGDINISILMDLVQIENSVAEALSNGASFEFGVNTECGDGVTESMDASISVYPNPASDRIAIVGYPTNENAQVTVYNAVGQQVYVANLTNATAEIAVGAWSEGVYTMVISSETFSSVKKVNVVH